MHVHTPGLIQPLEMFPYNINVLVLCRKLKFELVVVRIKKYLISKVLYYHVHFLSHKLFFP